MNMTYYQDIIFLHVTVAQKTEIKHRFKINNTEN
jgi:hypothetical protein